MNAGTDNKTNQLRSTLGVSRQERIATLSSTAWDVVVIGGGIHGACVAKLAARAGLRTALLEWNDFASATSSRSSKMAHGGLRYLEMLDFEQVFEGIKAREELFEHCPHLVHPEHFLIPVPSSERIFKWKLGIGLYLYDLMVRSRERKHSWIPRSQLPYQTFNSRRTDLAGCYRYTDGLMKDARLVIELIVSAAEHGATTLNYARVDEIKQNQEDKGLCIKWSDTRTGQQHSLRTKIVINCAGPWAPNLREAGDPLPAPPVAFSRGSHLIFSTPWKEPSLFLPLPERGRYYFVWPHPAGTMVGTTERETSELPVDPAPSEDEITEVLERIKRDLPGSGLTRDTLVYAFAGIRTLPIRPGGKKRVSQYSRKHIWSFSRGVLSLVGGKYTTFAWTAREGLALALKQLGISKTEIPHAINDLPGNTSQEELKRLVSTISAISKAPHTAVTRAVTRLGKQCERYLSDASAWEEITPGILRVELLHAVLVEQSVCVEDIMRRRLEVEYLDGHGLAALPAVVDYLNQQDATSSAEQDAKQYEDRMSQIDQLLTITRGSTEI